MIETRLTSTQRKKLLLLVSSLLLWSPLRQASSQSYDVTVTPAPPQTAKAMQAPVVVYLLLDGFRFDYIERYDLHELKALRQQGAYSPDGMFPAYPSVSGPNHVALMTGLYPTHSGIVANQFYVKERDVKYKQFGAPATYDGSLYTGTPLWAAAERAGLRTAGIYWNGCGIESNGVRMTYYADYSGKNATLPGDAVITQMGKWLDLAPAQRPHLFSIVLAQADHVGHQYGTNGPEIAAAVREIDGEIGALRRLLASKQINANIVIVSDHGMADIQGPYVDLDRFADLSGTTAVGSYLYPENEQVAARIYKQLEHASPLFAVYRRADLPFYLHYDGNDRVGDPVIVPRGPYLIRAHDDAKDGDEHPDLKGMHGPYVGDMVQMRAVFLANGPDIRKGVTVEPFQNVDVYLLVASLLGVPVPSTDASCQLTEQVMSRGCVARK